MKISCFFGFHNNEIVGTTETCSEMILTLKCSRCGKVSFKTKSFEDYNHKFKIVKVDEIDGCFTYHLQCEKCGLIDSEIIT